MTYPPPPTDPPAYQPGYAAPTTPGAPTQPYPMYGPAPTPPPKRSTGLIVAFVVALSILLCGGTAVAGALLVDRANDPDVVSDPTTAPATEAPDPTPAQTTEAPSGGRVVVYEVTGDGPVGIVYLKEDGRTPVQVRNTELPWRLELTLDEDARLVTVTAIRGATKSGSIDCRITIDGEEVATKSAKGTFATATCTQLVLD